jgi:DNA polymerase III alpha subunit
MKIISAISLGYQQTYSPEMESKQHNYIARSKAIHRNSHAVAYCLMAFRCLWLKAHFAPEFWASVMSGCHPDKIPRYMSVARSEGWHPTDITYSGTKIPATRASGVKFGTLNINDLTASFTTSGDVINQGMIGVNGIGEKAAEIFEGSGNYNSIDEFVAPQKGEDNRKNKATLERLIKLGAFEHLPNHGNSKALWMYYQYNYTSDTNFRKELNSKILEHQGWNDKTIAQEVNRQIAAYKSLYPKRNKIPNKITNWKPKVDRVSLDIMRQLFPVDYTLSEKLKFQKEFFGFYLDSPLELFEVRGNCSIQEAKELGLEIREVMLEAMITAVDMGTTRPKEGQQTGSPFARVTLTDGIQSTVVFIWKNELDAIDPSVLSPGVGVRIRVNFDRMRNTFSLCRGTTIRTLRLKDANN